MILDQIRIPAINSISNTKRPFWSVIIPTYNCAKYLEQTLKSVLEQDPGPEEMQIEVVDDCSTKDDPEAVVREIGKGRVSFFRQPKNVGISANWTTCINRAKGHWVHILHGDDTVMPGFYNRLQEALEKEPAVGAAFSRYIYMNEESHWLSLSRLERKTPGILENWLEQIYVANLIETPAIVVKRNVYEKLGGFHPELSHAADWEMWKRVAADYPVWYEPQPLARYRYHSASDTSGLIKSGANIADTRKAIEISQSYLPLTIAAELSNQARENCAFKALNTSRRMLSVGDIDAAIAQMREGVKSSQSSNVIGSVLELMQEVVRNSNQSDFLPVNALDQCLAEFQSNFQEISGKQQAISLKEDLKLRETNLVIFPNWNQPEELYEELASIIASLINHSDKNQITLLINISNLSEDEANLFISEVVMNLLLEKSLDVADGLEISLFGQLSKLQWEALLPHITARIILDNENQEAVAVVKAENIPTYGIGVSI